LHAFNPIFVPNLKHQTMKSVITNIAIIVSVFLGVQVAAQENADKTYKLITGIRVNPILIYDLEGSVNDKVLLHGEVGVLLKKQFYTSVGYTAVANSIYNFNEYWFIGLNKKIPVSWVLAEEYNFNNNKYYIQTGINIKLSKIGNVFAFLYTPTDQFKLGLKVGVFIPLNVVL